MNTILNVLCLLFAVPFALFGMVAIAISHVAGYAVGAAWGLTSECRAEFWDQFAFGYSHMAGDR